MEEVSRGNSGVLIFRDTLRKAVPNGRANNNTPLHNSHRVTRYDVLRFDNEMGFTW